MTHPYPNKQDEDALGDFIDGENDALVLDEPLSNDYYYLLGWNSTKERIANGELKMGREHQYFSEESEENQLDWEGF